MKVYCKIQHEIFHVEMRGPVEELLLVFTQETGDPIPRSYERGPFEDSILCETIP